MQFLLTIFSRPKQKVKRSRSPPRWKNPGHDPFNQKSRSSTEWISLVQPEKFQKSQSTFEVDFFSQLGQPDRKLSIQSVTDPFSISVPRGILFMFNMEKNTYQCGFCELLTAEISVTRTSIGTYNRLTASDVIPVTLVYLSSFMSSI